MSKRILIIDDSEDNRRLLLDRLTAAGDEATRRIKASATLRGAAGGGVTTPFSPRGLLAEIRDRIGAA